MPLSLLNHSALAFFAQRTRIPTSARSTGFCAIWVCISSSSSSSGFHWVYGFQPADQVSIPVVFRSTRYRGAPSQVHSALTNKVFSALAAVRLYNSAVRGLYLAGRSD